MKPKTLITISLFLLINYANTLNILGILPYQGKSHFFQFQVYLRELARRGHNITVISYFPQKNPPANYHDVFIGETKTPVVDIPMRKSYLTVLTAGYILAHFGMANCRALVASKRVQDLVKTNPKFDVVVVEQFNTDCALGIAYKLGAPVVGMMTHVMMPYHYNRFGIPSNPAFVSNHFLEGGTTPSLYQRLERTIFNVFFKVLFKYMQWNDRNALIEQFGDIPPLEDLAREMKILLLYQNFILTGSNLFPSNVIEVGGYHVAKSKPLTGDLKEFVENAENGIIYISFGSVIKSFMMLPAKKQAILDALEEFPQRFIWRWDDQSVEIDKNKAYISNWLPQVDILAHPKTLGFVSHSGMASTTESIHYGVPMIAVPFFGDQPANAMAIKESGIGVHLDINELNKNTLIAALRKILDPKFRKNVTQVSRAWHDRPMSPLDTAVYWTEFAARNANFTFRTPAADKPLYQHLSLDIAVIFVILTLLIIYPLKFLIKILCPFKRTNINKCEFKIGKKITKRE